jgi:hypothetical protein
MGGQRSSAASGPNAAIAQARSALPGRKNGEKKGDNALLLAA